MSIELQNITKLYGEQKAVNKVSLSIKKGEITGLLGPNGAGKSTLMKIISCFLPPSSGSAKVNGINVMDFPELVKAQIGYLPEHNPLYPEMYVREYLHYIAGIYKMKGDIKKSIDDVILQTGLQIEQNKKIGALSKGYRQRVGLAQALIHNPEILILDEPTTGLDPNQLAEIRDLIKNVGKEKTVLFSTHIMQEVEAICDRVIIIHEGKVIADDKTQNLGGIIDQKEIIIIEIDKEVDTTSLKSKAGINHIEKTAALKLEITAEKDADIRQKIFQWAVDSNIQILSMNKKENNLESVFRTLTK
ncbi:MAG: gliding motility-associated ABC transporter ATP-binding subunit GldA [Bacteroidetes bacterium 4572_77]|nr:MAG: gliding motility-associated ABC transporter ATP-binding subunit GldA [Bacteroidetes bacterium 4572_77]